MTSGNPDLFYPVTVEERELKMLTAASIRTLKPGSKKCGNEEEVFRPLKDLVGSGFYRLKEIVIKNQSVNRNKVGNWECLSLLIVS